MMSPKSSEMQALFSQANKRKTKSSRATNGLLHHNGTASSQLGFPRHLISLVIVTSLLPLLLLLFLLLPFFLSVSCGYREDPYRYEIPMLRPIKPCGPCLPQTKNPVSSPNTSCEV